MFDPIDLTGDFIGLCFAIFFVFWVATAFTTKRTVERRGRWIGPIFLVALVSMVARVWFRQFNFALWPRTLVTGLVADAMALGGLLVMLWARVTLGRNWSGGVVLKQDHELVTRGPYAFVRHPIYSGLLLMVLGWAVWRGDMLGLLSPLALVVLLWIKSRAEERLMIDHFGDAYLDYKKRVKALVPYVV